MTVALDSVRIVPTWKRSLYGINALVAAFGVSLSFVLTTLGTYPSNNTNPTSLGNPEQGAIGRVLDFFTYFTIWSNILVAIIMAMLFFRPTRDTFWFRVMRHDAVLMIVVTGIIYNAILAGAASNRGLEVVTNAFEHILTPLLTFLVWLICGPRGWINVRVILASLILPLIWVAWALTRGMFIDAYPYGFLDVAVLGYGSVAINIGGVIVLAILLSLILWGVDWIERRVSRN